MNKTEKQILEQFEKVCKELGKYKKTLKEFYALHKSEMQKKDRLIASLQKECQELETAMCCRD